MAVFVVFARWNAECLRKSYEPAEIFLGTNAFGTSSTRLTKQLVSVRRPFPQTNQPRTETPNLTLRNQPFFDLIRHTCVAASLRVDPFPKSQLYTETPHSLLAL